MWEGIVGEFMSILPKTLIVVLSSSLFVALIINPPFISEFMKIDDIRKKANIKKGLKNILILIVISIPSYLAKIYFLGNILVTIALIIGLNMIAFRPMARWFQTKFLVWLEKIYTNQLRHALTGKWPLVYLGGTFLLLILSLGFYFGGQPKVTFFPDTDPQTIYVTMELPLGTSIARTDEVSRKVEDIIKKTLEPVKQIVKSVTTNVGVGHSSDMFENQASPNKSLTSVSFVEYKLREGISTSVIMQKLTENLNGFVGAKIYVEKDDQGPPTGAPIKFRVSMNLN